MPRYTLANFQPYPKPRGQIGRHGNITHHADPRYNVWRDDFRKRLFRLSKEDWNNCYGYGFVFDMDKKPGHKADVDNLVGGIFDSLVPHWMIDDDWEKLSRIYIVARKALLIPQTILIPCDSRLEYHRNFIMDN